MFPHISIKGIDRAGSDNEGQSYRDLAAIFFTPELFRSYSVPQTITLTGLVVIRGRERLNSSERLFIVADFDDNRSNQSQGFDGIAQDLDRTSGIPRPQGQDYLHHITLAKLMPFKKGSQHISDRTVQEIQANLTSLWNRLAHNVRLTGPFAIDRIEYSYWQDDPTQENETKILWSAPTSPAVAQRAGASSAVAQTATLARPQTHSSQPRPEGSPGPSNLPTPVSRSAHVDLTAPAAQRLPSALPAAAVQRGAQRAASAAAAQPAALARPSQAQLCLAGNPGPSNLLPTPVSRCLPSALPAAAVQRDQRAGASSAVAQPDRCHGAAEEEAPPVQERYDSILAIPRGIDEVFRVVQENVIRELGAQSLPGSGQGFYTMQGRELNLTTNFLRGRPMCPRISIKVIDCAGSDNEGQSYRDLAAMFFTPELFRSYSVPRTITLTGLVVIRGRERLNSPERLFIVADFDDDRSNHSQGFDGIAQDLDRTSGIPRPQWQDYLHHITLAKLTPFKRGSQHISDRTVQEIQANLTSLWNRLAHNVRLTGPFAIDRIEYSYWQDDPTQENETKILWSAPTSPAVAQRAGASSAVAQTATLARPQTHSSQPRPAGSPGQSNLRPVPVSRSAHVGLPAPAAQRLPSALPAAAVQRGAQRAGSAAAAQTATLARRPQAQLCLAGNPGPSNRPASVSRSTHVTHVDLPAPSAHRLSSAPPAAAAQQATRRTVIHTHANDGRPTFLSNAYVDKDQWVFYEEEFLPNAREAYKKNSEGRFLAEDEEYALMYDILRAKFRDAPLRDRLIATGDALIIDNSEHEFRDQLGMMLMDIRDSLARASAKENRTRSTQIYTHASDGSPTFLSNAFVNEKHWIAYRKEVLPSAQGVYISYLERHNNFLGHCLASEEKYSFLMRGHCLASGEEYALMRDVLRAKFEDASLRGLLIATGDALIINNSEHEFWGWGRAHRLTSDNNKLGKILMEIRDEVAGAGQ